MRGIDELLLMLAVGEILLLILLELISLGGGAIASH